MKMNSMLGFAIILFSQVSSASTHKEVLISLFEQGSEPASSSDFATIDFHTRELLLSSLRTCAIVDEGDNANPFLIANVRRDISDVGPLLPGKQEEKLVFANYKAGYEFAVNPSVVDKDLVVVNPIYRSWFNGTNGTTQFISAHLYARKSGEYIAFRLNVDQTVPGFRPEIYYGYCYENGRSLF